MGGAWVADAQRLVWAEADRYGVAREHDALPAQRALALRRRARRPRAAGRRRATSASSSARSRRCSRRRAATTPTRPPDAQGLEDLDVPGRPTGSTRSGLPRRACEELLLLLGRRRARRRTRRRRLACSSSCAGSRPPTTASGAHLEAAVLGWRFPDGTAALYEAIAADVARRDRCSTTPVTAVAQDDGDGVTVTTAAGEHAGAPRRRHRAARRAAGHRVRRRRSPAKRAPRTNHAGQGVKAWVIARGVPGRPVRAGPRHAARLRGRDGDRPPDGVLLVCFGPSAADARRDRRRGRRRRRPRARARGRGRRRPRARLGAATPTAAAPGAFLRPGQVHDGLVGAARAGGAASTSPARTPRCAGRRSWTARSRAATAWLERSIWG